MRRREVVNLEEKLARAFAEWDSQRETGCSDPFYDDAVNLNLLRNHIIYWKVEIEKKYGVNKDRYPKVYFRETPPEMDNGFMVRATDIRDKAPEVLDMYLADNNFQYLLFKRNLLNKKEAENTHIDNVLGYVSGLADALKADDLIIMRRHASRPDMYLSSFSECAEKVKKILDKKRMEQSESIEGGQMTLFQMGLDMRQCR